MIFILLGSSTAASELGTVSGRARLSYGLYMKLWSGGVGWGGDRNRGAAMERFANGGLS